MELGITRKESVGAVFSGGVGSMKNPKVKEEVEASAGHFLPTFPPPSPPCSPGQQERRVGTRGPRPAD